MCGIRLCLHIQEGIQDGCHMIYTPLYEARSEIIETLAFYPEHIDLDKQNSALIIISLL